MANETQMHEEEVIELLEVQQEIARMEKKYMRIGKVEDVRMVLINDLVPILGDLVKGVQQRLEAVEDVVATVIEESDSMVKPDLAKLIATAIMMGTEIAARVKSTTQDGQLLEMITKYEGAAKNALEALEEVTIEDEDDEEDANDQDGANDDDDDEDTVAAEGEGA